MNVDMNALQASINNEFVERAYSTKQVDEANTSEILLGLDAAQCFFLLTQSTHIGRTNETARLIRSS